MRLSSLCAVTLGVAMLLVACANGSNASGVALPENASDATRLGWRIHWAQKCNIGGSYQKISILRKRLDEFLNGSAKQDFRIGYRKFSNLSPNKCDEGSVTSIIETAETILEGYPIGTESAEPVNSNTSANLGGLTDQSICNMAVAVNGQWETDQRLSGHVAEAQRRGLKCGVLAETRPPKPQQKRPTIEAPENGDNRIISAASGSGFTVSLDGHVITNEHVIKGCKQVYVRVDDADLPANIIAIDKMHDLALLKADFKPKKVLSLSRSNPELLQEIYVAGYPFGLRISSSVKVTKGIVSSLTGIGDNYSNIQIDAALQTGNSGGPIIDTYGNVIGVAVSKLDAKFMYENFGLIPENTNFGIKSSLVMAMLDSKVIANPSPSKKATNPDELRTLIRHGTHYISCWMTVAQMKAMQQEKVMFSTMDK